MLCIDNTHMDAWFNLAAEEYLLKNFSEDIFMAWRNEPSVIIGKHQNIWDEINTDFIQQKHIKVVRRFSGGGAVYHDPGNINVTYIENGSRLQSVKLTTLLIDFLKTYQLDPYPDQRQTLKLDGLKISGSAQCIHKKRIMYHATLLFSTNLYYLTVALESQEKKSGQKDQSRPFYVKSVHSPVTNICNYLHRIIPAPEFKKSLINYFIRNHEDVQTYIFSDKDLNAIRDLRDNKYATPDWNLNIKT